MSDLKADLARKDAQVAKLTAAAAAAQREAAEATAAAAAAADAQASWEEAEEAQQLLAAAQAQVGRCWGSWWSEGAAVSGDRLVSACASAVQPTVHALPPLPSTPTSAPWSTCDTLMNSAASCTPPPPLPHPGGGGGQGAAADGGGAAGPQGRQRLLQGTGEGGCTAWRMSCFATNNVS